MMLYTKYESSGPCSFGQEDCILKTYFFYPGIIPVKFGQNPISGFRGDFV